MEVSKKEKHESIIIEIVEYDNLETVLSKIVIPFSEVMGASSAPDVYTGYEKIPFKKRYPLYQTIMRHEFANTMRII